MKQIFIVLLAGFLFACGDNQSDHSDDLMVAPEDTTITSYPPGNTPVPPNVQPYGDAPDADTTVADSAGQKSGR
jgi:hypothetical protein